MGVGVWVLDTMYLFLSPISDISTQNKNIYVSHDDSNFPMNKTDLRVYCPIQQVCKQITRAHNDKRHNKPGYHNLWEHGSIAPGRGKFSQEVFLDKKKNERGLWILKNLDIINKLFEQQTQKTTKTQTDPRTEKQIDRNAHSWKHTCTKLHYP